MDETEQREKSPEQRARIGASVRSNVLFSSMPPAQYEALLDAMFEARRRPTRIPAPRLAILCLRTLRSPPSRRPAMHLFSAPSVSPDAPRLASPPRSPQVRMKPNEFVIRQGEEGDYFYVVESGEFEVYVAKDGGPPRRVMEITSGGTFGELALMDNTPRRASVCARTEGVLWAVGRATFQSILVEATLRHRKKYEPYLNDVPLLAAIDPYERSAMADCLVEVAHQDREPIIRVGDKGDAFYIVLEGNAAAVVPDQETGKQKEVMARAPAPAARARSEGPPCFACAAVSSSGPSLLAAPDERPHLACRFSAQQYTRGSYFGEVALLRNEPRKVTVIAKGEVLVARMDVTAFRRLLARPLQHKLEQSMQSYSPLRATDEKFVH